MQGQQQNKKIYYHGGIYKVFNFFHTFVDKELVSIYHCSRQGLNSWRLRLMNFYQINSQIRKIKFKVV